MALLGKSASFRKKTEFLGRFCTESIKIHLPVVTRSSSILCSEHLCVRPLLLRCPSTSLFNNFEIRLIQDDDRTCQLPCFNDLQRIGGCKTIINIITQGIRPKFYNTLYG